MASFKVEYEVGKITKTLIIKGEVYQNTFQEYWHGMMGGADSFLTQIEEKHPKWVEYSDVYNAIDNLDFANEDEIIEALAIIQENIENE